MCSFNNETFLDPGYSLNVDAQVRDTRFVFTKFQAHHESKTIENNRLNNYLFLLLLPRITVLRFIRARRCVRIMRSFAIRT